MCISTPGSIVTFPSTYLTNCKYTLSGLFFHLLNWDIYSVFTLLMTNHIMATIVKSFLGEENCTSAQFSQTFLVIPMRVKEMQLNFRNTPVLGVLLPQWNKHHDQKQVGEERVFISTVLHGRKEGRTGRIQNRSWYRGHEAVLLTDFLHMACSAHFLIEPRTTSPSFILTLTHKSCIKKMPPPGLPTGLRRFPNCSPLLSDDSGLCKDGIKPSQDTWIRTDEAWWVQEGWRVRIREAVSWVIAPFQNCSFCFHIGSHFCAYIVWQHLPSIWRGSGIGSGPKTKFQQKGVYLT